MELSASQTGEQPIGYRIDDLYIDLSRQSVLRDGVEIPLSALSFDLLLALTKAAPRLVAFDELMHSAWPGLIVSPETLTQRVKIVRDALGDNSRMPRYIAGVRGRGYRVLSATPVYQDSRTDTPMPGPVRRERTAAYGFVVIVLAAAAGIALFTVNEWPHLREQRPEEANVIEPPPRSIAVLPFANMTGNTQYEYISDGLTEELLNRLADVTELRVVGRTSSFHFKGRSETLQQIGSQLGVRFLIEGSVRSSGERIRVTIQLIDAQTSFHVWSQTYSREMSDMLALQDEIAVAVVDQLAPNLLDAASRAIRPQRNAEALELYLRAGQFAKNIQLDQIDDAIRLYERALELDPEFGEAYVGLANALAMRRQAAELEPSEANFQRSSQLLRRAIEIDPMSGDAYANLGTEFMDRLMLDEAAPLFERAIALRPNSANVNLKVSQFQAFAGWPPDRCLPYAQEAERLDPLNPFASVNVGICLWHAHRNVEALQRIDHVNRVNPEFWVGYWLRAAVLRDLGKQTEAMVAAQRALSLNDYSDTRLDVAIGNAQLGNEAQARAYLDWLRDPSRGKYTHPTWRAWVLVALGDHQGALDALDLAYTQRDWALIDVPHVQHMLPLHGEPRFKALVKKLGQERRAEYVESVAQASAQPASAANQRDRP